MKHYGLNIAEGSEITNITVATGTSFPANDNAGELFFRTDTNTFHGRGNSGWNTLMFNVLDDTTPQLGGNLDLNNFSINTADETGTNISNTILIQPGSSGLTSNGATNLQLLGADNTSNTASAPGGSIIIQAGDGGNSLGGHVDIIAGKNATTNGSGGYVSLQSASASTTSPVLRFHEPAASGNNYIGLATSFFGISANRTWILPSQDPLTVPGQFLKTDGSGNLSFDTPTAGIADVVSDLSPQLGGNLLSNGNDIIIATGDKITITDAPVVDTDAANKVYVDGQVLSKPKLFFFASF